MLEVPFSLVLFFLILLFVLGIFSIVMIVRMVMQQMNDREEEEEDDSSNQESDSSTRLSQNAAADGLPVPEHCKPLLLFGLNTRHDKIQIYRAADMTGLQHGQLTSADESLLKNAAELIQSMIAEEEEPGKTLTADSVPTSRMRTPLSTPDVHAETSKPAVGAPALTGRPSKAPQPAAVPSVAVQINAVLQTILSASSEPVPNLRLDESPSGDVRIWLDSQAYSSIDAVPNPAAVALLRKAADQWSKSHSQ